MSLETEPEQTNKQTNKKRLLNLVVSHPLDEA